MNRQQLAQTRNVRWSVVATLLPLGLGVAVTATTALVTRALT